MTCLAENHHTKFAHAEYQCGAAVCSSDCEQDLKTDQLHLENMSHRSPLVSDDIHESALDDTLACRSRRVIPQAT